MLLCGATFQAKGSALLASLEAMAGLPEPAMPTVVAEEEDMPAEETADAAKSGGGCGLM